MFHCREAPHPINRLKVLVVETMQRLGLNTAKPVSNHRPEDIGRVLWKIQLSNSHLVQLHQVGRQSVEAIMDQHAQKLQQLETEFKRNNASSATLPDYTALLLEEYHDNASTIPVGPVYYYYRVVSDVGVTEGTSESKFDVVRNGSSRLQLRLSQTGYLLLLPSSGYDAKLVNSPTGLRLLGRCQEPRALVQSCCQQLASSDSRRLLDLSSAGGIQGFPNVVHICCDA
ncbi:hypothetical protein BKA70DRAFT_1220226 [Coprinopsis sp. MPI-PUGE-AT-0042]|nr:hypothetical protein BKA70DRAFT_1220226 [Coprinopsis sp. MPI-PUGE-AT-0042]